MWRLHLSSLYVGHISIIKRPRSFEYDTPHEAQQIEYLYDLNVNRNKIKIKNGNE